MFSKEFARAYKSSSHHWMMGITVFSFILLATGGLLGLSSCTSTEQGVAREHALYLAASNTLANAQQITPTLPAPANGIVEGVLGVGGALLAIWATHLQRSIKDLTARPTGTAGGPARAQAPAHEPKT